MVLVNKILNILNSMEDVATVMYETGYSANLRIDRKPSPYAILYLVQGADLDLSNNLKESCEVEVYFCKENKLDADGLTTQAVIDDMMVLAKQFISLLKADKTIRFDEIIHLQNAFGKFDKHTAGVSVQMTISERQAHCIDYEEPSIKTLTITENGEYNTTQYGRVIVNVVEPTTDLFYIKNETQTTGTLTITNGGGTLRYSTDAVNWTDYDFTTHPTISVAAGQKLYLKGAKSNPTSSPFLNLSMDVYHSIGGNIMSIVDETNYESMTNMPMSALRSLFNGDATLIDASLLNFGSLTRVSHFGMAGMFMNCTSLVSAPNLSNITSVDGAGMGSMFNNCQSLKLPPDLSNITSVDSAGMGSMFNACIALSIAYAPNISTWNVTSNWLNFVPSTGTLYCPSQEVADIIPDNNASGCPSGWVKRIIS